MIKEAEEFERKLKLMSALGSSPDSKLDLSPYHYCHLCIKHNEIFKPFIHLDDSGSGCMTIYKWAQKYKNLTLCPVVILPHTKEGIKIFNSLNE
jgi:hypothetical protein